MGSPCSLYFFAHVMKTSLNDYSVCWCMSEGMGGGGGGGGGVRDDNLGLHTSFRHTYIQATLDPNVSPPNCMEM